MKIMKAEDLVRQIAIKVGISKRAARQILAELIKIATEELKKGRVFTFPGLGRMVTAVRKARNGRNPDSGALIKIARRRVARFLFSKKAKEVIEGKNVVKSLRPIVRVFYATDREPNPRNRARFGSRRSSSESLNLGTCDVSIPRDHRMAKIERPSILRLELRENPAKHFVIKDITEKKSVEFYSELSERVRRSKGKEAFVFIHGFRVAFEDAIYRTAQIAYDLAFAGAPILYSWPSNEKLYEYVGDINNNDWTTDHLKVFLQDLALRSGTKPFT